MQISRTLQPKPSRPLLQTAPSTKSEQKSVSDIFSERFAAVQAETIFPAVFTTSTTAVGYQMGSNLGSSLAGEFGGVFGGVAGALGGVVLGASLAKDAVALFTNPQTSAGVARRNALNLTLAGGAIACASAGLAGATVVVGGGLAAAGFETFLEARRN